MNHRQLLDQEVAFKGKFSSRVRSTLLQAYRPYMPGLLFSLSIGLVGRTALLANTNLIGYWMDSLTGKLRFEFVRGWTSQQFILALTLLWATGFVLTFCYRVLFSRLSAQAISQIYDETTARTSRFPMSFFDRTPAGRIITRFSSDYGSVFRLFGGPLAELGAILFDLFAMIVLIFFASPYYAPLFILIIAANYLVYRANSPRLLRARRDLSAIRSPSIAHFAETAQGAPTIRSFIKQETFRKRFSLLDREYLRQRLKTTGFVLRFSAQMNFSTAILLFVTGALAWWLLHQGIVTAGSIAVAFSFVALSGNTIQMLFEWLTQFEEAMVGVERLDHYLHSDIEAGAKLPASSQFETGQWRREKPLSDQAPPQNAKIEFQNVHFRYRDDLPEVFKGLSFTVQPGERLGVIGRTGSGKSSLIQALFYLYPIASGTIAINGMTPQLSRQSENGIDLEQFRKLLSFISQESVLFAGSLRDNLDITGSVPEEKLYEALAQVGLEDWANTAGLAMTIDEKGRNLSLGEKQLICMARCLLQQAPVVILDEATSSVDPQSELIMVRATEEFFSGRTQIIIAHRLSTLEKCDRILWLQHGQIKMIGKPTEVLPIFEQANLSL